MLSERAAADRRKCFADRRPANQNHDGNNFRRDREACQACQALVAAATECRIHLGTPIRRTTMSPALIAFHLYWAFAEMAYAGGQSSLRNERLRRPSLSDLGSSAKSSAKANMRPLASDLVGSDHAVALADFSPPSTLPQDHATDDRRGGIEEITSAPAWCAAFGPKLAQRHRRRFRRGRPIVAGQTTRGLRDRRDARGEDRF